MMGILCKRSSLISKSSIKIYYYKRNFGGKNLEPNGLLRETGIFIETGSENSKERKFSDEK